MRSAFRACSALVAAVLLAAAIPATSRAGEGNQAPAPSGGTGAAADEATHAPASGRRLVADSTTLVYEAGRGDTRRKLSDVSEEEAALVRAINRTRGTHQSYLLATSEDLPMPFFHHGFIFTLPPPGKRLRALQGASRPTGAGAAAPPGTAVREPPDAAPTEPSSAR